MALCTADFEVGVNGNAVLTADAGSATAWNLKSITTGSINYDTAHIGHGAMGCKIDAQASAVHKLAWNTAFGTPTDHYGRAYLYLTAYPTTANLMCIAARLTSASPVVAAGIQITTAGLLRLIDGNFAVAATFATIFPLNQLVRFEWHFIHSATVGQIEGKLFSSAESSTATETQTTAANKNTKASIDEMAFGQTESGQGTVIYWIDSIVAGATSYPGPVAAPAAQTHQASPGAAAAYYYYDE